MLDKAQDVAKDLTKGDDLAAIMATIGKQAKTAARALATAETQAKDTAINAMADAIMLDCDKILEANAKDMAAAETSGMAASFLDRLKLNSERVEAMADGLRAIAKLEDPIGSTIARWDRPNGLNIERVRTPLGVIGVIFESRPNVTADAGALCLKSGNAVILRGGSDSYHSTRAIHASMVAGLKQAGLPGEAIQIVPTTDRAAVGAMLAGLDASIDVIVPRGGRNLVERVQSEARVPVFAHLEGLCHVYVDKSANIDMACEIIVNAKMRRTGICGAAETLLLDQAIPDADAKRILKALADSECELRADSDVLTLWPGATPLVEEDWTTEYLAAVLSVGRVDGVTGAIEHIAKYSSSHTECIIAEDQGAADAFFKGIDSAILLHNASTQFADGGEFGMGAEIGIATGKMHARGPVGVEQLTSFKYLVRGNGQVRA